MKKILFILPCVPYPLTAGGNQAFFNMVEYIRHKMSVSLLLSPENKEMNDVESLRALWTNVDFYLFREEDAEPKTRCPRYYRWLKRCLNPFPARCNGNCILFSKSVRIRI